MAVAYILTNGGPFNSTQVLTTWAFHDRDPVAARSAKAPPCRSSCCPCSPSSRSGCCSSRGGRRSRDARAAPRDARVRASSCPFAIVLAFPFYWMVITAFKSRTGAVPLRRCPSGSTTGSPGELPDLFDNTHYLTLAREHRARRRGRRRDHARAGAAGGLRARPALGRVGPGARRRHLPHLPRAADAALPAALARDRDAGLQDSLWSLILVYPSFTIPFSTWLLMGFFKTIPPELEDAALIDGCSRLAALRRHRLPDLAAGDPDRRHLLVLARRERVHLRDHVHLQLAQPHALGGRADRPDPRRPRSSGAASWPRS